GGRRVAAAVLGPGPRLGGIRSVLDVDVHAEALLERAPRGERLGEEHTRVDRHDARVRRHPHELVDDHRLLLLEGAQEDEVLVAGGPLERPGQTAHSPSPRCTTKGALRSQSMNWSIVSRPHSTGIARSRTSSSKAFVPARAAKALNGSPSSRPRW